MEDKALYKKGRTDWAAGTIDPSLQWDPDYSRGQQDERAEQIDKRLQQARTPDETRESAWTRK